MHNFQALGAPLLVTQISPPIANFWLRACDRLQLQGFLPGTGTENFKKIWGFSVFRLQFPVSRKICEGISENFRACL